MRYIYVTHYQLMSNQNGTKKSKRKLRGTCNEATIILDDLPLNIKKYLIDNDLIQDGNLVRHYPKQPRYMEPFQTTSDFTHQYLALEPGIDGTAYRVFHYLCYVLDYGNWVDISTVWVAEKLNIKRCQVSRAISTLEKKGLLIRGEKIGRHYKWRLNPEATWKGTAKARWDSVNQGEIPYSDFVQKKLDYSDEHGIQLGYLRMFTPIEGGLAKTPKDLEKERVYNRELRARLYGKEHADGVEWKKLSEAEEARLHIRAGKVEFEMKESGEWKELYEKYFPPEENPKAQIVDLAELANRKKKANALMKKLLSSDVDLDEVEKLIKKSGTR